MLSDVNKVAAVTGAAGFLGSHLVADLLSRGWQVRAVVPEWEDPVRIAGLDVEIVAGDVTDPASLVGQFARCDVVFHLAGIVAAGGDPETMRRVNVDSVGHVVDEAHRVGALTVVVSSVAVFGATDNSGAMCDETHWCDDDSAAVSYERTKRAGFQAAMARAEKGARVRVACPGGIYGAGDTNALSPTAAMEVFTRFPVPVFGPADMHQVFVHVDDVADGLVRIAESGTDGRSYLLVESTITYGELFGRVARTAGHMKPLGVSAKTLGRLDPVVQRAAKWSKDPAKATETWTVMCKTPYAYHSDRARTELGWSPRPLAEGIVEVVERTRSQRMNPMPRWAWPAFPAMVLLGLSTRRGSAADRLLSRTGVGVRARRKIFAAAVVTHTLEAAIAWNATPWASRRDQVPLTVRTLCFGGPSVFTTPLPTGTPVSDRPCSA